MTMRIVAASPSGRYEVRSHAWEVRMSHWIESPSIVDQQASAVVYAPQDASWSLEQAGWESDSVVRLELRKYPGGKGMDAVRTIDCAARRARIDGREIPLAALDAALEKATD